MSSSMEQYLMPKHLDAPPMFLIWEADTAAVFMMFMMIGFMFNVLLYSLVAGLFMARQYARLKGNDGRGIFVRFMYWYTPSELWLKTAPPSHIREYIG